MSRSTLRALLVEDSEADAMLLVRELQRLGWQVVSERVQSRAAMQAALAGQPWDIVFSDFRIPGFGGMEALEVLEATGLDIPFILISGTIGEEAAVDALRAGAHDFLIKGKLSRLGPVIDRELREVESRRRRCQAEYERESLQTKLMMSDRQASMGILAAGVAHELNNPLTAITANLEFLARMLAVGRERMAGWSELPKLESGLGEARVAAERMRRIVRDLMVFARGDDERRGPVDVHRVIESTLRMAQNELRHRARVTTEFATLPPVDASESRLAQVFLNLVMNAAQAIEEGHADRNQIRISTGLTANGMVAVAIRDTGSGMPPEVVKRLFTPFFTTKPVGSGVGLGLSISQRIVNAFDGSIEVDSELGKGTCFRVLLPQAGPATIARAARARAEQPEAPAASQVRGRILVVDDESEVANAIRRSLEPTHEVVIILRAQEAADRLASGERFDLILCDLMMPEMTGMDLHAELARCAPEQARRMVFMTGGAFTPRSQAFLDEVARPLVQKPFDPRRLREVVAARLRETAGRGD